MPRRRIVLLVEPDRTVLGDFRAALESRGFQVWSAEDGAAGMRLARDHRPGVIVGDFPLDLPGDSAFTQAVRTDPLLTDAIIITVTDRHRTEKDSAAWQHSDRVIAKPIDGTRLADEVAWVVERRRAGDN